LSELSDKIPDILLRSHAPSTNKGYNRIFSLWEKWATKVNAKVLPASDYFVALFIISLGNSTKSSSTIKSLIPAITWGHRMAGLPSLFDTQFVRDIASGLNRSYSKPRQPKEPFSSEDLIRAVQCSDLTSLKQLRSVTMMVIAFMGFLRFDELSHLKWSDVVFNEGYISIIIRRSKTDQLREGDKVLIAEALSDACAVTLLKKYLLLSGADANSEFYIFRSLSNNGTLRPTNSPISYNSVRQLIKNMCAVLGLDSSKFGVHSLRSGGATEAANRDVPDRLFKRHGRWSSDSSKDLYIKDNVTSMLKVSRSLGV
jgi:integrase